MLLLARQAAEASFVFFYVVELLLRVHVERLEFFQDLISSLSMFLKGTMQAKCMGIHRNQLEELRF